MSDVDKNIIRKIIEYRKTIDDAQKIAQKAIKDYESLVEIIGYDIKTCECCNGTQDQIVYKGGEYVAENKPCNCYRGYKLKEILRKVKNNND